MFNLVNHEYVVHINLNYCSMDIDEPNKMSLYRQCQSWYYYYLLLGCINLLQTVSFALVIRLCKSAA
jgi:hypothetical protein